MNKKSKPLVILGGAGNTDVGVEKIRRYIEKSMPGLVIIAKDRYSEEELLEKLKEYSLNAMDFPVLEFKEKEFKKKKNIHSSTSFKRIKNKGK